MDPKLVNHGQWWEKAWSLVDGCTPISPGCANCWLAALAYSFARTSTRGSIIEKQNGRPARFNSNVFFMDERLQKLPKKPRVPTVYSIWADLFHEKVSDAKILATWRIMAERPTDTFLVLTKRVERMFKVLCEDPDISSYGALPNVYLGATFVNQEELDKMGPTFIRIPGKKFLSLEPLLGPISLTRVGACQSRANILRGVEYSRPEACEAETTECGYVDQVIVGGETGLGARPTRLEWIREIRDQCHNAGTPFFFKHFGEYAPSYNEAGKMIRVGRKAAGRALDGRSHNELIW